MLRVWHARRGRQEQGRIHWGCTDWVSEAWRSNFGGERRRHCRRAASDLRDGAPAWIQRSCRNHATKRETCHPDPQPHDGGACRWLLQAEAGRLGRDWRHVLLENWVRWGDWGPNRQDQQVNLVLPLCQRDHSGRIPACERHCWFEQGSRRLLWDTQGGWPTHLPHPWHCCRDQVLQIWWLAQWNMGRPSPSLKLARSCAA